MRLSETSENPSVLYEVRPRMYLQRTKSLASLKSKIANNSWVKYWKKFEEIIKVSDGGCAVNEWVCGRSLFGIAGSNPTVGMDFRLL